MLNDKFEKKVWVDFEVKGMDLQTFKEFKKLSNEYNGSYPITIKVLLGEHKIVEQVLDSSNKIEIIGE